MRAFTIGMILTGWWMSVSALAPTSPNNQRMKAATVTANTSGEINRLSFLQQTCASLLFVPSVAFAKDIDPAVKGTKKDPKYESCVSSCMFECTKPKGDEQKSRAECLPGCKKECATTKEQLMIGAPKASS